jgi:hypothetical protein
LVAWSRERVHRDSQRHGLRSGSSTGRCGHEAVAWRNPRRRLQLFGCVNPTRRARRASPDDGLRGESGIDDHRASDAAQGISGSVAEMNSARRKRSRNGAGSAGK